MINFGFYILGEKGYQCLLDFIDVFGVSRVSFVCSAHDFKIETDFYDEIRTICENNLIPFHDRSCSSELEADYVMAIGWRWLIDRSDNLIVFHDSLLPKYRGFAPLVNALVNGEEEVGVTALKASKEYDEGPVIRQASMEVNYPIKIQYAIKGVVSLYSKLLIEISGELIKGLPLNVYEQDHSKASYSSWRNEDDYLINWSSDSEKIERFINAVGYPYAGAKTKVGSNFVRIGEVEVVDDVIVQDRCSHIGKVLFMRESCPVVICGSGLLKIISIFDEEDEPLIGKIPFRTKFGG